MIEVTKDQIEGVMLDLAQAIAARESARFALDAAVWAEREAIETREQCEQVVRRCQHHVDRILGVER